MKTSKKILICAIIAVVGYVIASFWIQFATQSPIDSTLTYCWFGFWSIEIFAMAGITKSKVKNRYYDNAGLSATDEVVEDSENIDDSTTSYDNDTANDENNI